MEFRTNRQNKKWLCLFQIFLLLALVLVTVPVSGEETGTENEETKKESQILYDSMSQRVYEKLSDKVADKLKKEIIEEIREDLRRDIKNDMFLHDEEWLDRMHISVPEWTKRIRLYGDIRLRYENIYYEDDNALILDPTDINYLLNTFKNRERYRMRARLGLTAEVNRQADVILRLATGSDSNPVSTNETFGDYFNKDEILLDQAYLRLLPSFNHPQVEFLLGRFPVPWVCTDMVWDSDVGFEGVLFRADMRKTDRINPVFMLGAFPLQEENWYSDKWLYGAQLGVEYRPKSDLAYVLTAAYYHYHNIEGTVNSTSTPNENDWTSPLFQQKGNTLINIAADSDEFTAGLASAYELLNITGYVESGLFFPVIIRLTGDYVENLGFDTGKVEKRTGVSDVPSETTGLMASLLVGHSKVRKFGEWQWSLYYKHLEADAALDAFVDSDFHMGGTNAKGWALKFDFGVMKNIWLSSRWLSSNEIEGVQISIDQFQLDLNAKF